MKSIMKKCMQIDNILRAACAAFAIFWAASAGATPVLVISGDNGSETLIAFSEKPKVSYSGTKLTVATTTESVEFDAGETVKCTIADRDLSAAATLRPDTEVYAISDVVEASGLAACSKLQAYDANGRLIAASCADQAGNASLDLSSAKGVIIIKSSTKSFKIKR